MVVVLAALAGYQGRLDDIRLCQHKGGTAAAELAGIDSCLVHYQQAAKNEQTTTWGLVSIDSNDPSEVDNALDVWEPLLMLIFDRTCDCGSSSGSRPSGRGGHVWRKRR